MRKRCATAAVQEYSHGFLHYSNASMLTIDSLPPNEEKSDLACRQIAPLIRNSTVVTRVLKSPIGHTKELAMARTNTQRSLPRRRLTIALLFLNIFLGAAGSLLIIPVLPALLNSLTKQDLAANSIWAGLLFAVYGLMQLLFAPIVGSLSDRYGRRPVLLLSSLAFAFDYVVMATAQNILLLFLGRLVSGITGASVVAAFASTADISEEKSKAKYFALMYVAGGLGAIAGPAISGILFQVDIRAPFWGASVANGIIFVMILLFFQETLPAAPRKLLRVKGPFGSLRHFSSYVGFRYMFAGHFLLIVAIQAPITLWAFYTKSRLGWNESSISSSLVMLGILSVLVQSFLVPYSYSRFGLIPNCYFGFAMLSLSLLIMSFSTAGWMLYMAIVPYSLSTICNSAVMSIYSSKVLNTEQGEVLGVLSSIGSLGGIISPMVMSSVYSICYKNDILLRDGTPFLLGFFLTLASIALFRVAFRRQHAASK